MSRDAAGDRDCVEHLRWCRKLVVSLALWGTGVILFSFGFYVFFSLAGTFRLLLVGAPPVPWSTKVVVGAFGALFFVCPYLLVLLVMRVLGFVGHPRISDGAVGDD